MTRDVVTVEESTSLKDVARLLVERRISGLPVVDATGGVVGVISEADFVTKEAAAASLPTETRHRLFGGDDWRDAPLFAMRAAATAGEAMTAPAITIEADRSLGDAARLMHAKRVNRLPVTHEGALVGIISRADLVRAFARDDAEVIRDVRAALRSLDGIEIGVRDGVVSVVGTVAHPALVPTISQVVASIPGVTSADTAGLSWREPEVTSHQLDAGASGF
jgi:CBS domain-containing protein